MSAPNSGNSSNSNSRKKDGNVHNGAHIRANKYPRPEPGGYTGELTPVYSLATASYITPANSLATASGVHSSTSNVFAHNDGSELILVDYNYNKVENDASYSTKNKYKYNYYDKKGKSTAGTTTTTKKSQLEHTVCYYLGTFRTLTAGSGAGCRMEIAPHGQGRLMQDRSVYEGEYSDGMASGRGVLKIYEYETVPAGPSRSPAPAGATGSTPLRQSGSNSSGHVRGGSCGSQGNANTPLNNANSTPGGHRGRGTGSILKLPSGNRKITNAVYSGSGTDSNGSGTSNWREVKRFTGEFANDAFYGRGLLEFYCKGAFVQVEGKFVNGEMSDQCIGTLVMTKPFGLSNAGARSGPYGFLISEETVAAGEVDPERVFVNLRASMHACSPTITAQQVDLMNRGVSAASATATATATPSFHQSVTPTQQALAMDSGAAFINNAADQTLTPTPVGYSNRTLENIEDDRDMKRMHTNLAAQRTYSKDSFAQSMAVSSAAAMGVGQPGQLAGKDRTFSANTNSFNGFSGKGGSKG